MSRRDEAGKSTVPAPRLQVGQPAEWPDLRRFVDALLKIVRDSIAVYEAFLPKPWSLDADDVFVDRMLTQIVGFRVDVEKIEGKFKLNQNHPVERREKVVRALREQGGENAEAVAAMMLGRMRAEAERT